MADLSNLGLTRLTAGNIATRVTPAVFERAGRFFTRPDAPAPAPPAPTPAPAAAPPPTVPAAPGSNPFEDLPFPSPGDRIKADDFKRLSQALRIVADMSALSGSLFGRPLGDARLALAGQGYEVAGVVSVFGIEWGGPGDTTFDTRKVLLVAPVALGGRQVRIVVTEAVDTRRLVPDLGGRTFADAQRRVLESVGDVAAGAAPPTAPSLVGLTLAQLQERGAHTP